MTYLTTSGIIFANSYSELISHLKSPWNETLSNHEYIQKSSKWIANMVGQPTDINSEEEYIQLLIKYGLVWPVHQIKN